MNKRELIMKLAEDLEVPQKEALEFLDKFLAIVANELVHGREVLLVGFGKFMTKRRAAKYGVNPRTLEKILIPAKNTVRFIPGKFLKEAVA